MALVFDSFRLKFARIRLSLHELARRGRRPRPSPTAVSFTRRRRPYSERRSLWSACYCL